MPSLARLAVEQLDVQVGVEGVRDAQERVDSGRSPSALEPRDRGLRRADELGEVGLGKPALLAPVGDLAGDLGEEPALLGSGETSANSLHGLTHISIMLYIAIVRYALSIAAYISVVVLVMAITAASEGSVGAGWAELVWLTLIALHLAVGFSIGRWWAILLVILLPILAIPVPTATECGEGCEPLPLWFGLLLLGVPVGAALLAMGIGARKLRDRRRSPEVA